jgi:hypothetical protein
MKDPRSAGGGSGQGTTVVVRMPFLGRRPAQSNAML